MSNVTGDLVTPCPPLEIYFFAFHDDEYYKCFMTIMVILNIMIALISLCSNFCVIYTIVLTKVLQTPSNSLILGLAVSDFGVGLVSQPCFCVLRISAIQQNVLQFCAFGQVFQASIWTLATVSFFTYTAITADRYLALHLHLRYKEIVTTKKIAIILGGIWTLCITVAVTRLEFMNHKTMQIIVMTIFVGILMINIYCVLKIAHIIRRHTHQINVQRSIGNRIQLSIPSQRGRHSSSHINMPRYKKSVYTMYYVLGVYALCYVPFMIALLVQSILGQAYYKTSKLIFCVQVIGSTLIMFNGALNPVIYYWRIHDLRSGTLQLLRTILCCNTRECNQEPPIRLTITRLRQELTVPPEDPASCGGHNRMQ